MGLLLSGCTDGEPSPASEPGDQLVATADTGLLRGVVVDEAFRPVAGVAIAVSRLDAEARSAETGDDGTFGFDGLAPGSYVVQATKAGYLSKTVVASVQAQVAEPPIVQVPLARDLETIPYVIVATMDGFIECGVRGGTGGVAACRLADGAIDLAEESEFDLPIDPGPSWLQTEMVWEANQPLADYLGFYVTQVVAGGYGDYMGIYPLNMGVSPLLMTIDSAGVGTCATCVERPLPMGNWTGVRLSAMAGELASTTPPDVCSPTGSPCLTGYGAAFEQRFTFYQHVFYRGGPPDGWRFTSDGAPPL